MGRYLLIWELDQTRMPLDLKERGNGFNMLTNMVREDMKAGKTKDWGVFVGEYAGYSITEDTEVELMSRLQRYAPYVHFKVHPIGSLAQVDEMIKTMTT